MLLLGVFSAVFILPRAQSEPRLPLHMLLGIKGSETLEVCYKHKIKWFFSPIRLDSRTQHFSLSAFSQYSCCMFLLYVCATKISPIKLYQTQSNICFHRWSTVLCPFTSAGTPLSYFQETTLYLSLPRLWWKLTMLNI